MSHRSSLLTLVVATLLPVGAAWADDHIPGPDESSSPSRMLSSKGNPLERAVKQRKARSSFEAVRGDAMPRTVVASVETRSGDDEDRAWEDQAPTRKTGIELR